MIDETSIVGGTTFTTHRFEIPLTVVTIIVVSPSLTPVTFPFFTVAIAELEDVQVKEESYTLFGEIVAPISNELPTSMVLEYSLKDNPVGFTYALIFLNSFQSHAVLYLLILL
nr:hypothetical protein [Duncaniella muris]